MFILLNFLLLVVPLFAQEEIFIVSNPSLQIDPSTLATNLEVLPQSTNIINSNISEPSKTKTKVVQHKNTPKLLSKPPVGEISKNYQAIEEFFYFIKIGDIDSVVDYLNLGMDANIRQILDRKNGTTALMCSIAHRRVFITKLLLTTYKADPNLASYKFNISNITPLMLAAQQGPIESIKTLLTNGAKINAQTTGVVAGNSALMIAIQQNKYNIVKLLIDNDADVNNISDTGITPLMIAAKIGNIDIVNLLIATPQINIHTVNKAGQNALIYGYISGNIEIVQLLTKLGITTNLTPKEIKLIIKQNINT